MAKTEFQGLTKRTRTMLASNENLSVDFKREASGVKSSDFVAFANANGGTLLIGVDEYTSENGLQRGRVVGCAVNDKARLALINKALECTPSINILVIAENLRRKPMLRIEIPADQNRPFCNSRGEYSVRADGRNRALYPSELLDIFLDSESALFSNRFKRAVGKLEQQVKLINTALNDDLQNVSNSIENFEGQLHKAFVRIGQLTDSSKKRTRSLLHSVQNNQHSLVNLERAMVEDVSAEMHADHFEILTAKLDRLTALLKDKKADNSD
ncbi:MAG: ATP-binding protein [Oceanospirillaceae bacterium]|nr:ATP-binding protein [Oceanospirillaceae bacterium]